MIKAILIGYVKAWRPRIPLQFRHMWEMLTGSRTRVTTTPAKPQPLFHTTSGDPLFDRLIDFVAWMTFLPSSAYGEIVNRIDNIAPRFPRLASWMHLVLRLAISEETLRSHRTLQRTKAAQARLRGDTLG